MKSQNIFLSKDCIKIGDFGISKILTSTLQKAKTMIGTPLYLSPEILQNEAYSFKSDIWALGVILYEMCALKMPFDSGNMIALSNLIMKGIYNPIPEKYSKEMNDLVKSLLNIVQEQRPTINEILSLFLNNPRPSYYK